MAQTLFLPPVPAFSPNAPSSPDPTPLRLIAFSVAEAALMPDPNSPSLAMQMDGDWNGQWSQPKPRVLAPRRERLWNVVERAKERKSASPPAIPSPLPSPPISPGSYNFTLPPHSPFAASIAAKQDKPRLALDARPFPLYTRSAEPSPVKSTFSSLDQTVPPPEFHPVKRDAPSQRLRQQATSPVRPDSRHTARLPSLKQIQAKMNPGHRRGGSVESIPLPPRPRPSQRADSEDSVEMLQTPTDECPPSRPRIVFGNNARPPTPPSPTKSLKESRLAPFLRERTSGRLAGGQRPVSMPPLRGLDVLALGQAGATVPPPSPSRTVILNTPPKRPMPVFTSTPASPTGSLRSSSTSSPTLSVPTITCTPAPARLLRDDGIEQDSDEEGNDVVLFEGDSLDQDRTEREERGRAMLERLTLRRRSD